MCNRYYNETTIQQMEDLLGDLVEVLDEARNRPHKDDLRPTDEVLLIFKRDQRHVLGTGFWGFPRPAEKGGGLTLNARSEVLDTAWRHCQRCWMPATGWVEYVEEGPKKIPHFIASPDGAPMLLAGVCAMRGTGRRVAMCMQDAPPNLAYLCTRLPMPYGLDAIGAANPAQIISNVTTALL